MDKAKGIDEFVQRLAESLEIGERVRYDLDNLTEVSRPAGHIRKMTRCRVM